MKKLLFLVLAFASLSAGAQQNKLILDPNAKQRMINGTFTAVSVSSGIELYLSQSNETTLAVSVSDEKYADRLKTEVESEVLKIYFDNKGITWGNDRKRKLKVYLSVKTLEKLTASAGASVLVTNTLTLGDFKMKFTSGAFFSGEIKATVLGIDQDSGSQVSISGTASSVKVDVSSGAILKGYELKTENCEARASSGGMVRITINKELTARASSGGIISYKGMAVVKDMNVNSGGTVKKG